MADTQTISTAQPSVQPARRKRGKRFWITLSASVLLGVPVLLYGAAWGYVNLGFMNRSIEKRISARFGTPSHVGSMKTDAFKNLSINEIAIDPDGAGEPLTIGATKLHFGLIDFLRDNRIRTLTLERPRIALRYDPVKGWNHALKFSNTPGEPMHVNRFEISDGAILIEWPQGGQFALSNINGSFADAVAGVTPFTLRAEMPSADLVSVEGQMGPGRAFNSRIQGSLNLNRDAPRMAGFDSGLKGTLQYDFVAKREPGATRAGTADSSRDSVAVNGIINLNAIEWQIPHSAGQKLSMASQNIAVQGVIEQTPTQPGVFELRGVKLDFGTLGALSGDASVQRNAPQSAKLTGASGTLDLANVDALFHPPLLGDHSSMKGTIDISDFCALVPLEGNATPTLDGRISTHDVQFNLPDGRTVPIEGRASLSWPALKNVFLRSGNLWELQFEIANLNKSSGLAGLADAVRIIGGKFNIKEMYAPVGGEINAGAVKLAWLSPYSPDGASKLRVSGLQVNGIAVDTWVPLLPASEWSLSGPLVAELDLDHGALTTLLLIADLAGQNARNGLSASGSVRWKLERNAATWKTTLFEADSVSIPLASAGQVWARLKDAGILVNGYLKGSGLHYDSQTHAFTGRVHLENGQADIPITDKDRVLAADALDFFDRGYTAAILRKVDLTDLARLKELSADVTFSFSRGKARITGTTKEFPLYIRVPLLDKEVGKVPPLSFAFDSSDMEGGTSALSAELGWSGGKLSTDALLLLDEKLSFKLRGFEANGAAPLVKLDGALDFKKGEAGPLSLSVSDVTLRPRATSTGAPDDWGGAVRDLRMSIEAFSFAKGAPMNAAVRITGRFDKAAVATKSHSLAQLDGPFLIDAAIDKEKCLLTTTARLESYAALLGDAAFYVPPPAKGKPTAIKLALALPFDGKPFGSTVHIDACDIDCGGLAKFSAVGLASLSGGELTSLQLRNVELAVPSLSDVTAALGPPNLKNREPWFGDLKLGGRAHFAGACAWTRAQTLPPVPGEVALDGNLQVDGGSLRIGAATPFTMDGISGTIPVSLRHGAGPPRDGGPRAKIYFENAAYATLVACKQNLEIEALSNGFTIHSPLDFASNGALLSIGPVTFGEILPSMQNPRCTLRMSVLLNLDQILRNNGVTVAGLSNCILSGEPIECALVKTEGLRGPWELRTGTTKEYKGDSVLSAPFYGGKLVAKDFNARGIFGPAPSFGGTLLAAGQGWPERNDGINVQEFLKHYPQFGKFNVRMTGTLSGFETSSLDLAGIQSFTLDLASVPGAKNEYWYDGALAMALNYPLVRNSFPGIFDDKYIRALTFGVRDIALQFSLTNGSLFGPRPKLPGGMILRGYGAESNPFASRYKKDIKGDRDYSKDWLEAVKKVREKFK